MRLIFSEGVMKGKISLEKFVELTCTNPAKIYGLYPKKGVLQPGADGDIVIIDARQEETLTHDNMHSAVDYTAYEGIEVQCKITEVLLRGTLVVKDNEFIGTRGQGEFLKRKPLLNT